MRGMLPTCLLSVAFSSALCAQSCVRVSDTVKNAASPMIYGQFLEHIYESVVGGLDAEMVRGRSFEEAVVGGLLPGGFEVARGAWHAEQDTLVIDEGGADYRVFFGDRDWTDYDYQVECQKISGREGFLIIFRAEQNTEHYWLNLGGWGNQYSALETEVRGRRSVRRLDETITIDQDRWYKVKISVRGPRLQCFLDNEKILDIEDDTHPKGRVGLGSWNTGYRARSIRVTDPTGKVLLEPKIEGPPPGAGLPRFWEPLPDESALLRIQQVSDNPLNSEKCLRIQSVDDQWTGIAQTPVAALGPCRGSVWLRGEGVREVRIGLRRGHAPVAEETGGPKPHGSEDHFPLQASFRHWGQHLFRLQPAFRDPNATLFLECRGQGELYVDQFSLRPDQMFKGTGCRVDIAEKIDALGPAFIRWPGGCYAHRYNWTDGIGSQIERTTRPNYYWGGLDPNGFGTDEFIQLCRDVGAEPLIVFNVGQDDATENFPEHFQDCLNWIEYCNGPADSEWGQRRAENGHPEPYKVVHWELGNETWRLGTDELCRRVKILSAAIRERWPGLVLWVCGSGGHNRDWNQKMLDGAAEAFDVLSVHHYQWGPSYEQRMAGALSYVRFLRETGQQIKQSANPDIRIGVTEWNLQTTSLETGLWAALFLMGCEQEPMVTYAAPALFIRNTDAPAWDNAFINIDHYRSYPAPNYLAMKLLHDTFGTEVLEVEVDTVRTEVQGFGEMAWLQASAVRDADSGAVHVRLVNLHPRQPSVTEVELPRAFPKATLRTMTGPELDSRNTLDEPSTISVKKTPCPPPTRSMTLRLPPHSVSVLSLTP